MDGLQLQFDFMSNNENSLTRLYDCTRIDIVGPFGLDSMKYDVHGVAMSLQDGKRTLKIFYDHAGQKQESYYDFIKRNLKDEKKSD